MDYKRVYDDFIKDRREKESSLTGYVERHHIVPRSLGGGDDPENLVNLTPEDHFFAHLCLAKIHGGEQWAPVALMVGQARRRHRRAKGRKRYGWAKRAMAKAKSREGAYQFDARIHHIEHLDGRVWSGVQMDMPSVGMSRSAACRLVNGIDQSAMGWFLKGNRPHRMGRGALSGADHHMYKSEVIVFRHVDGRYFRGTQFELAEHASIQKSMVCRLARGTFRCAHGWYVDGRPPAKTGRGAVYKLPERGQLQLL